MDNYTQLTMVNDEDNSFIADLTSTRKTMYCSLVAETLAQKKVLFTATNNPEKRLSDMINKTIDVVDVFCEVVTCVNEETGEQKECPRIVLIDKKGVGYQCVSVGVFSAIKKAFAIFGMPSWKDGLKIEVVQVTKGTRKMLTLNIV